MPSRPETRHANTVQGVRPQARTFPAVFIAVLANFTAFGAVIPVIPKLVIGPLGGTTSLVGAALAVSGGTALLLRPFAGTLAQRHRPRAMLLLGSAIASAAAAAYALPIGATGLIVARIGIGAAEALVMTAGAVWIVSIAQPTRLGRSISFYGLSMWGGLTIGPMIGELAYHLGSYPLVWVTAAVLPALAIPTVACLRHGGPITPSAPARLLPKAAILPGLALAGGGFGYACVTGFGALAMGALGIDGGAYLLSLFSGAYVIARLLAHGLPDRFGPTWVVLASGILEAAGLVLIALAPGWWTAAAGATIAGGGFALLYPSIAMIGVANAPESERGPTLGAISSFLDLSVGIAGLVAGALAAVSYPAVFLLSAALALAAVIAGTIPSTRSFTTATSADRGAS